jgi:hypothetical protein
MVLNNELLEKLPAAVHDISNGRGPPIGKLDHDYKVVIRHFWLR